MVFFFCEVDVKAITLNLKKKNTLEQYFPKWWVTTSHREMKLGHSFLKEVDK